MPGIINVNLTPSGPIPVQLLCGHSAAVKDGQAPRRAFEVLFVRGRAHGIPSAYQLEG